MCEREILLKDSSSRWQVEEIEIFSKKKKEEERRREEKEEEKRSHGGGF